ncbi:MAG: SH3 domain-containing C40 family peptidase [Lachnospiraceae bacterium]|nr:SH3 domain-containing C40 family peptidase [Lachnospiraceae bacterium]
MINCRRRVTRAFVVGTLLFIVTFTAFDGHTEVVAATQTKISSSGLTAGASSKTAVRLNSNKTKRTAGATSLTSVRLSDYNATGTPSSASSAVTVTGAFDPSAYGYSNLGIVRVSEGNVNIRKAADASASIVGKASDGDAVEITGQEGDFYAITSGQVTGYIKSDYVLTGSDALSAAADSVETIATVTGDGVNVREGASTDSEILGNVAKETSLGYLGEEGTFIKVDFAGQDGYISSDFVTVSDTLPTASTLSEIRYGSGVSDVRVDLVNYALQFVGNRYRWGGTSLTNGVDCSGFTMQIYAKYGISLPHYSGSQAQYGHAVSLSEAKPGDLVFYGKRRIHHVAIYIGNGQIVHAASRRSGIKISNVNYSTPCKIVSILD